MTTPLELAHRRAENWKILAYITGMIAAIAIVTAAILIPAQYSNGWNKGYQTATNSTSNYTNTVYFDGYYHGALSVSNSMFDIQNISYVTAHWLIANKTYFVNIPPKYFLNESLPPYQEIGNFTVILHYHSAIPNTSNTILTTQTNSTNSTV